MKDILKNKTAITISLILLILIASIIYAVNFLSDEKKELKLLKKQFQEVQILKKEYLSLKRKIDAIESKKDLSRVEGIIQAIDEIFTPLGLKDKLKTVKSTGTKQIDEGFEEGADIYIEEVTMNEMVNIFYSINHSPMILTMKKATIKKSFDNPKLLNISLTLSLIRSQ